MSGEPLELELLLDDELLVLPELELLLDDDELLVEVALAVLAAADDVEEVDAAADDRVLAALELDDDTLDEEVAALELEVVPLLDAALADEAEPPEVALCPLLLTEADEELWLEVDPELDDELLVSKKQPEAPSTSTSEATR